jgi:hypothetical protein
MTFILGYILSLNFLAFMVFSVFWLDYLDQHEWSAFFAVSAGVISYFIFHVDLYTIGIASIGYFCFGVVWSIYRYKQYVDKGVRAINSDSTMKQYEIDRGMAELTLERNKSKIVSWIINWPISMIVNISSDLIRMITNFVTNTMKSVYNRIYENSVSNINVQQKETK